MTLWVPSQLCASVAVLICYFIDQVRFKSSFFKRIPMTQINAQGRGTGWLADGKVSVGEGVEGSADGERRGWVLEESVSHANSCTACDPPSLPPSLPGSTLPPPVSPASLSRPPDTGLTSLSMGRGQTQVARSTSVRPFSWKCPHKCTLWHICSTARLAVRPF